MFCLASLYERICQDLQEKMLHLLAHLNSQAESTRPADFCEEIFCGNMLIAGIACKLRNGVPPCMQNAFMAMICRRLAKDRPGVIGGLLKNTRMPRCWRNPEGVSSLGHLSESILSHSPLRGCSFVPPPIFAPNSSRVTCLGLSIRERATCERRRFAFRRQ